MLMYEVTLLILPKIYQPTWIWYKLYKGNHQWSLLLIAPRLVFGLCEFTIWPFFVFIFTGTWHILYLVVRYMYVQMCLKISRMFFSKISYVEILRTKSIKSIFSAFISLFLSRIIENKYWSRLSTCSQDSVALHWLHLLHHFCLRIYFIIVVG